MANATTVQVLQDGPRNTVAKFTGLLDTPTGNLYEVYNIKLNPATYRSTYSLGPYGTPATWRIDFIEFSISDGIVVNLFWDATINQLIVPLAGRGNKHFKNFGGISGYTASTAGGWTGSIGLNAEMLPYGQAAGSAGTPANSQFSYMIVLDLVQQGPNLS